MGIVRREFEHLIQEHIDKDINIIIRIAVVVAFSAAYILYNSSVSKIYAVSNIITGCILCVFAVFLNKIPVKVKIITLIVLGWILAIFSYIGGGFDSAFIILMVLANILSILFMQKKGGIIYGSVTIVVMCIMAKYTCSVLPETQRKEILMVWGLQIVCFVLLISIMFTLIHTMKDYLFHSLSDLESAVEYSNHLAFYDQTTKLPNEYKFKLEVEEKINLGPKDAFLILVYIRNLRAINALLGSESEKQALLDITDVFKEAGGKEQIIARISDSEFAVWDESETEEELIQKQDFFLSLIKEESGEIRKKLELTVGYAKFTAANDNYEDTYRRAMLALSYAKMNEIRGMMPYKWQIDLELKRREQIKDIIESAIKNRQITLSYQPKVDSRTGKVIGVEALARWHSDILGEVSPNEFVPIIESMNLSTRFGNYIIRNAFQDYEKLQHKYHEEVILSINLSPSHIMNENIVETINELVMEYQIPKERIVFEITENILIEELKKTAPIIEALREMNIRISLDDFGTGYSSLSYMGQLAIDEIKIDKTFVQQMQDQDKIRMIIDITLRFARKFNLEVIAEGVETKEQVDILAKMGCFVIQGFYYARPEPLN